MSDVYDLIFVAETKHAVGVKEEGGSLLFWLPKFQIHVLDSDLEQGDEVEVEIPDWLAEQEDLL